MLKNTVIIATLLMIVSYIIVVLFLEGVLFFVLRLFKTKAKEFRVGSLKVKLIYFLPVTVGLIYTINFFISPQFSRIILIIWPVIFIILSYLFFHYGIDTSKKQRLLLLTSYIGILIIIVALISSLIYMISG